jgi:hypothetical protein
MKVPGCARSSFGKVSRRPYIAFGIDGEGMWSGLFEYASRKEFDHLGWILYLEGCIVMKVWYGWEGVYIWSGILKLVLGELHFSVLERMVIQIGQFKWHRSLLIVQYDLGDQSYRSFVLEVTIVRYLQSLDGFLDIVSDYQHCQ